MFTTVAPLAEMRPSERGAPLPGKAHSSSARSACRLTLTSGRVTSARPSPLMLATNEAGTAAPPAAPVALSTTTTGGCAGPGLDSSTARPIAAMLAKADTPRHSASWLHQLVLAGGGVAPPMRASMRFHTAAGGLRGSMLTVKGISRDCHSRTAARKRGCAGSSASKRRRAGPRRLPLTYSAARWSARAARL